MSTNATCTKFPYGMVETWQGNIHPGSDTLKVLLLANTYTYDKTDQYVSDLTPASHEHDGSGYARVTLTSAAVTLRSDGNGAKLDALDTVFANLAAGSNNIKYAVIYKHVTGDSDSPLLFIFTFASDIVPDGSDFTLVWPADGIALSENRISADAVTYVDANSSSGQKVLNVASTAGFVAADTVLIDQNDDGDGREFGVVDTVQAGVSLTLQANLTYSHTALTGDVVTGWHP